MGLDYNYYRDYDPNLGRYLQSDPIGLLYDYSDPQMQVVIRAGMPLRSSSTGMDLNHSYNYVNNNPVGSVDPFGLESDIPNPADAIIGLGMLAGMAASSDAASAFGEALGNAAQACMDTIDEMLEDEDDRGCEAVKQSVLNTCASLQGAARRRCLYAAEDAYQQCMDG